MFHYNIVLAMRWKPWFICLEMPLFQRGAIAQYIQLCCDLHSGETEQNRRETAAHTHTHTHKCQDVSVADGSLAE